MVTIRRLGQAHLVKNLVPLYERVKDGKDYASRALRDGLVYEAFATPGAADVAFPIQKSRLESELARKPVFRPGDEIGLGIDMLPIMKLGGPKVVDVLQELVESQDPVVVQAALRACKFLDTVGVSIHRLAFLRKFLEYRDPQYHPFVARMFARDFLGIDEGEWYKKSQAEQREFIDRVRTEVDERLRKPASSGDT